MLFVWTSRSQRTGDSGVPKCPFLERYPKRPHYLQSQLRAVHKSIVRDSIGASGLKSLRDGRAKGCVVASGRKSIEEEKI